MASIESPVRSIDRQQHAAAERARARLAEVLDEWEDQRSALTADKLGRNPFRRVREGWPDEFRARGGTAARGACVIDDQRARREASRLASSAKAKLLGAAVSFGIPLSIVIAIAVVVGS